MTFNNHEPPAAIVNGNIPAGPEDGYRCYGTRHRDRVLSHKQQHFSAGATRQARNKTSFGQRHCSLVESSTRAISFGYVIGSEDIVLWGEAHICSRSAPPCYLQTWSSNTSENHDQLPFKKSISIVSIIRRAARSSVVGERPQERNEIVDSTLLT